MKDMSDTAKEQLLQQFLAKRYNVRVENLEQLDRGVFSIVLAQGQHWIARVFSPSRPLSQVEGDASILQFLEQQRFPAERCATASPVSTWRDWTILVTTYIEGTALGSEEHLLHTLGQMLAHLHLLPVSQEGAMARPAGALHHYVRSGGHFRDELAAAASWLLDVKKRLPREGYALYDSLHAQLANADPCDTLPQAFIHPDPVCKNVRITDSGEPIFIDWTGAGTGSRLASFAVLLWSCAFSQGGWSPRQVDAVVAGYRQHLQLDNEELEHLDGALRLRLITYACWRYRHAINAGRIPDGTERWWPDEELVQMVAHYARAALQLGKNEP